MGTTTPKPKMEIRRFDVFAEYTRLERRKKGMDEAHAKGYGLWVAKVVASGGRKDTGGKHEDAANDDHEQQPAPAEKQNEQWHELSGEPQTDALFDHEIIDRMGKTFYARVFSPAISRAVREGRRYESIRDTLRKDWKPAH